MELLAILGVLFALYMAGKCQRDHDEWIQKGIDEQKLEMHRRRMEQADREREEQERRWEEERKKRTMPS